MVDTVNKLDQWFFNGSQGRDWMLYRLNGE